MNLTNIQFIHEYFLKFHGMEFNPLEISKTINLPKEPREGLDIYNYVNYLTETGGNIDLAYISHEISINETINLLKSNDYPLIVFANINDEKTPVILHKGDDDTIKQIIIHHDGKIEESTVSDLQTLRNLIYRIEIKPDIFGTIVITGFKNESIYSQDENYTDKKDKPKTPLKRFYDVLFSEKKSIIYLYIYAIIAGIISLSLPLGIQSIIGFITSGQISTSIVVLISFVTIGVLINGGLQIMQLSLTEHIQQRLFLKTAFDFSYRLPKLKIESLLKHNPPELINRFFDIVTLQKGVAKILIDFSTSALQIFFGLLLLALYHPSFLFMGILLLIGLYFIIKATASKALKSSIYESKHKYEVANWLEELARTLKTFKLAGYSNLPIEKTDYNVSKYLYARESHFKVLITQYKGFVGFKTLLTAGLLIIGCVLVVNREINIGQFVASEIIIIMIINAIEKLIHSLEIIYDILASVDKLGVITDLPIEKMKGVYVKDINTGKGLSIEVKKLDYKFAESDKYSLKNINFKLEASERLCISGYNGSGKTTLLNVLLGFYPSYKGIIRYSGISLKDLNKNSLLNQIGDNITYENIFDGTIEENITLGRKDIPVRDLYWAMDSVGLSDYINELPDGLKTNLVAGHKILPTHVAKKIILARSIVRKPKLLILDEILLNNIDKQERYRLLDFIFNPDFSWTVIIISNNPNIMKICNNVILLKDGQIVTEGPYEAIKDNKVLRDIIND